MQEGIETGCRLATCRHSLSPLKTAYLRYSTPNLGDDVQSLALEDVLGKPNTWLDRDRLNEAPVEATRLIANGFFICGPFPPPPQIDPAYVAICTKGINGAEAATLDHLRKSGPVGCRDQFSLQWCQERDVPAYFASCPTILLKRTVPWNPEGPIVLVDVDPSRLPLTPRPIRWLSNRIDSTWYPDPEKRREVVRERLRLYQSASLVITHRLHVAMPCLGFGTPVIVTKPWYFPPRHTALPVEIRIHEPSELKEMDLDPDLHRHDVGKWKQMVEQRLRERLEQQGGATP